MRRSFWYALTFVLATTLPAHAVKVIAQTNSQSDSQLPSMSCDDDDRPLTSHSYASIPGDILQPHHLELGRPFAANGKLILHVCNADLRVRTQPDAKEIRLNVDLNSSDSNNIASYIRTLYIQPDRGTILLKFPEKAHAIVTINIPMGPTSDSEIDLAKGDLNFYAAGGSGHREINLGMGHMQLLLDNNKSYSKMEVNVGMGSLHDHRPGGHDGHFVVSKEYAGIGAGSLEINVGMGSLDIRND